MDKVIITKAKPADATEILKLQHLVFQSEAALYDNYHIEPLKQTIESFTTDFDKYVFLKATRTHMIVGSIKLREEKGCCWVGRLMVHPDYQRKGIGRQLLSEAENIFTGIRTYELFTGSKSVSNIRLYESVGYQKAEEYTDERNPGVILIRMVKVFCVENNKNAE